MQLKKTGGLPRRGCHQKGKGSNIGTTLSSFLLRVLSSTLQQLVNLTPWRRRPRREPDHLHDSWVLLLLLLLLPLLVEYCFCCNFCCCYCYCCYYWGNTSTANAELLCGSPWFHSIGQASSNERTSRMLFLRQPMKLIGFQILTWYQICHCAIMSPKSSVFLSL